MTREKLVELSKSPIQAVREMAKKRLDELDQAKAVSKSGDFSALINDVNDLIISAQQSEKGGMSAIEVEKIVSRKLKEFKENFKAQQPDQPSRVIEIQRNKVEVAKIKQDKRALFYVVLSDYEAMNNVYLYGEAGTGKTFLAGQIAEAINYKLITLNCNQFTSPIDIIGGQTIDGYQEGRLSTAWANKSLGLNKNCEPYEGALLLLDELPKLDPNTAGLLNDALSKLKDPPKEGKNCDTGESKKQNPIIMNGRGESLELKNLFVIATGNSLLNEANKDYEANFKQDLSLQDRFAGSCYRVSYNYDFEYQLLSSMNKYDLTFVFNFLAILRQKINEANLNGVAFVSTRIMVSCRDTFNAYIENRELGSKALPNPKTLQQAIKSFLTLFSEDQREGLIESMQNEYDEFMRVAEQKQKASISELKEASAKEKTIAEAILEEAKQKREKENSLEL